MTTVLNPVVAVRGSDGLHMNTGPPEYEAFEAFTRDTSKCCRVMQFSQDGKMFAWCNGKILHVVSFPTCQTILEINRPRTTCLYFTPRASLLATWEPYSATADTPAENSNLHIWNVKTGESIHSFIQKKQSNWHPRWTEDEEVCARIVKSEIHLYAKNDFKTVVKRVLLQKVEDFSLSRGPAPYHVACYVLGTKGQPSFVKLFCYPHFEGLSAAIANKSFFKADKVDFFWNKKGTGLLLQPSTDVDKSGYSYYGEQGLHFMDINGDTAMIKMGKDGPIYSVEWSPQCTEFCAVYGYMPAKATIYNLKCEPVFDFGTGPRNLLYYNVHGNLLILAGFGNLRGNVEVWDVKAHKLVIKTQAEDSTFLEWSPDGEHFITATTSPRLRVSNGFKIWHYTGSLLCHKPCLSKDELWEVMWQPCKEGSFPEKAISYTPVAGIQSTEPKASTQAYRPPGARGQPSTFKLHELEPPSNKKPQTVDGSLSKNALKNKKKKEARKAKKEMEMEDTSEKQEATQQPVLSHTEVDSTGDPERDKKIRNISKKLDQIAKLKRIQDNGGKLELNQLEKLKKEEDLLKELKELEVV